MEPNEQEKMLETAPEEQTAEAPAEEETSAEEAPAEEEASAEEAPAEEAQAASDEDRPPLTAKFIFDEVIEIAETVLFSVFVILLIFSYLVRPVTVDGRSMVPTLQDGDRLVMYRLCYQPKQGDIVVVNDHGGHILQDGRVVNSGYSLDECIIKRVIAVSGQEININTAEGKVSVDGVVLSEPYINEPTLTNDGAFTYPLTIPEGYIFVMGDNRNHSTDSRSVTVGLVAKEDVLGTAFFRYSLGKVESTDTIGASGHSIGFVK